MIELQYEITNQSNIAYFDNLIYTLGLGQVVHIISCLTTALKNFVTVSSAVKCKGVLFIKYRGTITAYCSNKIYGYSRNIFFLKKYP